MIKKILFFVAIWIAAHALLMSLSSSKPVLPTKQDFHSMRRQTRALAIVIPPDSSLAAHYRAALKTNNRRFRYRRPLVISSSQLDTLSGKYNLLFVGSANTHPTIQHIFSDPSSPFQIKNKEISTATRSWSESVLHAAFPNPLFPDRHTEVITSHSDSLLLGYLQLPDAMRLGDVTISKENTLQGYGWFAVDSKNNSWRLNDSTFVAFNFENDAATSEHFALSVVSGQIDKTEIKTFLNSAERFYDEIIHKIGGESSVERKLQLFAYQKMEHKGIATGSETFSHFLKDHNSMHFGWENLSVNERLRGIAEAIVSKQVGWIENGQIRNSVISYLTNRWNNDHVADWSRILFKANAFKPLRNLLTDNTTYSRFLVEAQLASLFSFIETRQSIAALWEFVLTFPANDSELNTQFPVSEKLEKDWLQWCEQNYPVAELTQIRNENKFAAGFCFAHEGYSVFDGYLGTTAKDAIQKLSLMHVNAISIMPFGYLRSPDNPGPFGLSRGVRDENDESVVIAKRWAKERGMQVMLKPHIWVSRNSWPGEIDFAGETDAEKFKINYENWILHYAMLAQIYRFDSFCIGTELVKQTQKYPDYWRSLITKIRGVYTGQLTYAANWGEEFENISFWDALDQIGLDCYYPLSENEHATGEELRTGVNQVISKINRVVDRYQKPFVFTEVGYPSRAKPWLQPHEDNRRELPDLNAQKQCFEALFEHMGEINNFAGMYIWKWPSTLQRGGAMHASFTPNGKPAADVISENYKEILQTQETNW